MMFSPQNPSPSRKLRVSRGVAFSVLGRACSFALLAGTLCISAFAQAPALTSMGTTELQQRADGLVNTQKYAEAIPYLEELYSRIKDNPTKDSMELAERAVYSLGLGYTTTRDLGEAVKYLELYLEKYKDKNIQRTVGARDMLGEAYYFSEAYDKAAAIFLEHIDNRSTPDDRKAKARLKLVDCYAVARQWDKLIAVARPFAADSRDQELQGRAVTALCEAYVETEQPEKVFELIPLLENSSSMARYRTDFNLSMIAAGDRLFQTSRFDMALPIYQIVAPKRLVEQWIAEHTESLKKRQEDLRNLRPVPSNLGAQMSSIALDLKRLEVQSAELQEKDSYDEELRTRIAQALFQQERLWEALWVYESLMDDFPESEHGETAGYAAFALAAQLGQRERAIRLGQDYMERFPKGENFENLSYQLSQLLVAARYFDQGMKTLNTVLENNPDHLFADKMLFLTGYSFFQEEAMDRAAEFFLKIRRDYPDSESRQASDYWYAMTYLYRSDYTQAMDQFRTFTEMYPAGDMHDDALFRIAVCQYALEKYAEAEAGLRDFIKRHPETPQVAEAYLLLGDIAGSEGRLTEALEFYRRVEQFTINQSNINLATMAAGRVMEALEQWDEMIRWFTTYLNTYGTDGLYAEAIYRIGFAKKQKGDIDGMLSGYFGAILEYGNKPKSIGVDMICRDWPEEYANHHGKRPDDIIARELAAAAARGDKALELRWRMMADRGEDLTESDLEFASPAVLIWIAKTSEKKGDEVLARKAYELVLERFEENEWHEPALLALARREAKDGKPEKALALYAKVRELFPASDGAAEALYEQAELLAREKKPAEAIALLELILEVKEWRGEPWARALNRIGDLYFEQGKYQEAFGYYQRVYVLYSAYKNWTAKAYLHSAKCLASLGRPEDQIKTLQEMVSNENYREQPEFAEAQKILSSVQ